jgi:uncharacterized protein involved in exopolysaccharide biosynthesis
MKDELSKMKDTLAIDQARYTDDYPDIVKLKKDIVGLQKEIDAQTANASSPSAPQPPASAGASGSTAAKSGASAATTAQNTGTAQGGSSAPSAQTPLSIQQLRATLKQDDIFISEKTKEQEKLQQQVKGYESRLQVSPTVEEEYNKLTLGHDAALKFYNTLLGNRDASQMSVNMESQGQGETFTVLDSPDLPQSPSFPVWWQFTLGGLAGGLIIGLAVASIFEFGDKSLRDERDIEFYLGLPTLALVPAIGVENGNRKGGRWWFFKGRRRPAVSPAPAEAAKAPV